MPQFSVGVDQAGQRLDLFLGSTNEFGQSRSFARRLVVAGNVTVNGTQVRPAYRLKTGDVIRFDIPIREPVEAIAEQIPLDVVYEDTDIIVVNKQRGMVVHPGAGNPTGTLVNALLAHCPDLVFMGDKIRPGIVHRLDKQTTGLLIVAKNEPALKSLQAQIKARQMKRIYLALVFGHTRDMGTIEAPIGRDSRNRKKMAVIQGGKHAVSRYKVVEYFDDFTFLEIALETGRTHQIRVHMAHLGFPVVGDTVYGPKKSPSLLKGQALHAARLTFEHPRTGDELSVSAPLPEDFVATLRMLDSVAVSGFAKCARGLKGSA